MSYRFLVSSPFVLLLVLGSAAAQASRLNDPLPQPRDGDVIAFAPSPDGAWVVYRADAVADGVFELYSARIDGSEGPLLLSSPLQPDRGAFAFAVAPGRALYLGDEITRFKPELYSVPLDAGVPPLRLNPPLSASEAVSAAWLAPDGVTVLYTVSEAAFRETLYRVPIDGSAPAVAIAVSGTGQIPFYATGVTRLEFSLDGQRAYFVVTTFGDDSMPSLLYSVAVDGSQSQTLLSTPQDDLAITRLVVSAASDTVAFTRGTLGFSDVDLWVAAGDGSALVPLATGAVGDFAITADGSRVAWVQGSLFSAMRDGSDLRQLSPGPAQNLRAAPGGETLVFRNAGSLLRVPIDGSAAAVTLIGAGATTTFEISADSSRLVAVLAEGGFRALRSVPLAGGTALLLNGPAVSGRGVATGQPRLELIADRALWRQDRASNDVFELFSAPLDASAPEVRISAPLSDPSDVDDFRASPDGLHAVYLADGHEPEVFELYGARLDGSAPAHRYHPEFTSGPILGDVLAHAADPAGGPVLYVADQEDDEVFELYSVPRDGRGRPRRVSDGVPGAPGDVEAFELSALGARVAFSQDLETGQFRLLAAPGDGRGAAVVLDEGFPSFPAPLRFTPDGETVVYRRGGSRFGLYARRADASLPLVHLNPGAISLGTVDDDFAVTPTHAVFRGDQEVDARHELYSVPLDGSQLPIRLSPELPAQSDVDEFRLSPDLRQAVFLADARLTGTTELFRAPVAGGPSVRLHPPLASDRDVTEFALTADGQRVVYRADQAVDQQMELYAAPLSGGSPPHAAADGSRRRAVLRLTPLANGEDVRTGFVLDPLGRFAFYRLHAPSGPDGLFRVPLDASAPPERLGGASGSSGVDALAASPDGAWVVYRSDEREPGVLELFVVASVGGPPRALDPLPSFADVQDFRITPDSAWVVYRVDRETDGVLELFAAPLDGASSPRRVSNPLASGRAVEADYLALPGGRALYRADQRMDEAFELFLGPLERVPLRAPPP